MGLNPCCEPCPSHPSDPKFETRFFENCVPIHISGEQNTFSNHIFIAPADVNATVAGSLENTGKNYFSVYITSSTEPLVSFAVFPGDTHTFVAINVTDITVINVGGPLSDAIFKEQVSYQVQL